MEKKMIINRVPHSIGVEINQGRFLKIIDKNSVVPAKGYQDLTLEPGVKQTTIRMYQGECEFVGAPGMQFVKSFVLKNNTQNTEPKSVQIHFTFNKNGMVEATAKILNDKDSETKEKVETKGLMRDEVMEQYQKEIYELLPDDY
ncbi:hypothetical protein QTN25_008864 [Entamoeba marina]